jgi:hypothetical protein
MPRVLFKPNKKSAQNYVLNPLTRQAKQALGVIFSYGDLPAVAKAALTKGEYANTDYGHGLEYPTRADRADQVRIWRWEWRNRKGQTPEGHDSKHKIIRRKFHIPEKVYLGVLVGVLECNGYMQEAAKIRGVKILEPISVQYQPNIYSLGQYKLEPFSKEAHSCLGLALYLKNLEQTRELAISRTSFEYLDDEAFMNFYAYIPDEFRQREIRFEAGNVLWKYIKEVNGKFEPTQQILPLELYLDMLEQLLFIHGLPTLRDDNSSLPTVRFEPQVHLALNYSIAPSTEIHVALLEIIVGWVRLEDWIKMVCNPQPYGMQIRLENDSGVMILGDEVTLTRSDRSKQSISKALLLSVLAAITEARGLLEDAARIQTLMPLEDEVVVQYTPNLYWQNNYQITPFDARAWDCLVIALCRQNLELAWAEVREKRGFQHGYYYPTFGLNFCSDGKVELKMPNGNDRIVPEALYVSVLEQLKGIHEII